MNALAAPVFADRRILTDGLWIAEPDRCTEPPFALGTGAFEFWDCDKSGIGGRWVVRRRTDVAVSTVAMKLRWGFSRALGEGLFCVIVATICA